MDRKKTKKIRSARIIATNIFMGVTVIAVVAILMMIAMGFTFNESGNLEQSGLLQITSQPNRATVEIDGSRLMSTTEINKMVKSGTHDIRISKSGFDTWERHLNLEPGLLTRIDWVRLFPIEQHISHLATFNQLRLISYSNDNRHLLFGETGSAELRYFNLQSNDASSTTLDLTKILSVEAAEAQQGNFELSSWNDNNNKVLLRWIRADQINWYLVNLNDETKTIDLTKEFNLAFDQIYAINDSASKLWAIENGNLHSIDVDSLKITNALVTDIETLAINGDTVAYVSKTIPVASTTQNLDANHAEADDFSAKDVTADNTSGRAVYSYRDGDEGSVKLFDLQDNDQIQLAMGTYWGQEWIAYSLNQDIFVKSGKYPTYKKSDSSSLTTIVSHTKLDYAPTAVNVNGSNRIIAFWSGKNVASIDIETRSYYDFELDTTFAINWLDNYLIWESTNDKIIVHDFDGANRREIINNATEAEHAIISDNNHWLYYFDRVAQTSSTAAETLNENQDEQSESNTPVYRYVLKRLDLTAN